MLDPFSESGWDQMMTPLTANDRDRIQEPSTIMSAIEALDSAVGSCEPDGKRRYPSAGGCYPLDFYIYSDSFLACVDFAKKRVNILRGYEDATYITDMSYAVVLRPWRSLRQYGPRGLIYSLLDAGHAMMNLTLQSSDDTPRNIPTVLQSKRHVIARGNIRSRADGYDVAGSGWSFFRGGIPEVLGLQNSYEENNSHMDWQTGTVTIKSAESIIGATRATQLRDCLATRRSARAFGHSEDENRKSLMKFLSCAASEGAHLSENIVDARPSFETMDRSKLGDDAYGGYFLSQPEISNSSAAVFLGPATVRPKLRDMETISGLLAVGMTGEYIYLAAQREQIPVTGVGGLDNAELKSSLSIAEWPIYAIAAGTVATKQTEKEDFIDAGSNHAS